MLRNDEQFLVVLSCQRATLSVVLLDEHGTG